MDSQGFLKHVARGLYAWNRLIQALDKGMKVYPKRRISHQIGGKKIDSSVNLAISKRDVFRLCFFKKIFS